MKTSTENSSENPLERAAEHEQVSVYSADFTRNTRKAEDEIVLKPLNTEVSEEKKNQSWFAVTLLKRRNAIGIAAILLVGILHFAFQLSIIENEKTQLAENPVKIEAVREPSAVIRTEENDPAEFEVKKADIILPPKSASPAKQRTAGIAPLKQQFKKKDSAPAKSERLRRAEKILTGI